MEDKSIQVGFLLAGLVNIIGILIFSLGFTNTYLMRLYPQVFSFFGLVVIILWGLAYIAVSKSYHRVRWLIGVFSVEKLVYTISWILWLSQNNLVSVFEKSLMTGLFYASYGLLDIVFGIFFLWVFFKRE